MSFELNLQGALLTTLKSHAPLMALISNVFDEVPQGYNQFPYVVIGEDVHAAWDTDTTSGSDVAITIHVWSRKRGRAETKRVQAQIYNALHRQDFSITGYRLIACDFVSSETFLDDDGKTRHGVQQFRILIDQQ